MASPLSWQTKLADGVSGVAVGMGEKLDGLASKFSKLGTVAAGADSKMRLGQDKQLTDLAAKLAKLRESQKPERVTPWTGLGGDVGAGSASSALAASMAKHDAWAARVQKSAAIAGQAMSRYRAAVDRVISAEDKLTSRSRMGKTGANQAGGIFGQTQAAQSALGRLTQAAGRMFGDRGANAVLGVAGALDRLHGAATRTRGGLVSLSSVGKGALSMLGSVAMAAAAATAAIAAMGVGLGVAGARYVVGLQSFKSSTMFALAANLKSASAGEEAWRRISEIAVATGNDLQQTAGAMNGLLAGGFKLGEAEELMRVLADMKTLDPSANLEGIALAIKQIKMTGKLQGDELNQLGNAVSVDAVYEELAKKLGKTKAEIIKMKEAGKITADDAIDAIKKATLNKTGMKAGGLAEAAASKTMVGNLLKAKAVLDTFLADLKIDFSPVARFLERVQKVLKGDAGVRFGKSIEGAFENFLGILDGISEKDIATGFDTASAMIRGAGEAAKDFAGAVKTIDGWMSSISSKTSAWGVIFTSIGATVSTVGGMVLSTLLGPLYTLYDLVKSIGAAFGLWGSNIQSAGAATSSLTTAMAGGATNAAGGGAGGDAQRGFVEDVIARFSGSSNAAAGAAPGGAAAEVTRTVQVNMTISAMGITTDQLTQQIAQQAKEAVQSELGKLE